MDLAKLRSRVKAFISDRNNLVTIGAFVLLFFLFLVNSVHESYPDEFDNILGGWYSLKGQLIYKDWFTHHAPIAYWTASLVEIFSGQSFVKFRFFYSILLFILTFSGFYYLKRSFGFSRMWFYLVFLVLFGISATYFWGHMLLADSFAAVLLVPVFGLVVLKMYYSEELKLRDFIFISVFSSLALLSSLTFSYLVGGVYLFTLFYYFFYPKKKKIIDLNHIKVLIILITPYLLFLIYLLITRSFFDFLFQAVTFNQQFYIYNYPRPEGQTFINPIRYAIIIAQNFHNNFSSLLIDVRSFNFTFPFNITLAVVNTGLIIFLLLKKKFLLAAFILFWLIYANVRSNPWISRETDYQSAVYIVTALFNVLFAATVIYEDLNKNMDYPKKLLISLIFVLIAVYSFFNFTFLLRGFASKAYAKYMGQAPLIYNRPQIAPVIESITNEEDVVWIGPFEFEELFYLDRKIPSNYIILLPEFARSPKIIDKMMKDFRANPPKVIYFDKQFGIRGYRPEVFAPFFLDFLNENYVNLHSFNTQKKVYSSNLPKDLHLDFETKLFIHKDHQEEVINKLVELGHVSREE